MPLGLDVLTHIVNVGWEEVGLHFLYSGADGMYGSQNGQEWTKAPGSVAAVSLAWVDDVWVGVGPSGTWRSDDGAKTWRSIDAPAFVEVVAMKPKGTGPDDESQKGIFAGWLEDEAGDNHIVYTSSDLGQTWGVALTIPTDGGLEDGFENIIGLSGCGGALFVCTVFNDSPFHHGDGKIYSSTDGYSFSGATVFGPGNTTLPEDDDQFPRIGFAAMAVGYDNQSARYIAIGDKEIRPADGVLNSYLVYTESDSPSFGAGAGNAAASATLTSGAGEFISVAPSAAGGNGMHVAGLYRVTNGIAGAFVSGKLEAGFIPGEFSSLQSMGDSRGGFIGSFCFKGSEGSTDEGSTDDGDEGIFACTAFDAGKSGGVYVASGGGAFGKTHNGTGIDVGGAPGGAVAVGKLGFLGTET